MCYNLHRLSIIFENEEYTGMAAKMVKGLLKTIENEPRYMTNWAISLHSMLNPLYEIVIVGDEAIEFRNQLAQMSLPNHLFLGASSNTSNLPLLEDRIAVDGKTTIYVCQNRTCQLPVHAVEEASEQMN